MSSCTAADPRNRKCAVSFGFQALLEVTHWYGWCMVCQLSSIIAPSFDPLRFIYDFVAFPNGIFSGTIISSVIHNGDIKKIAEWQLLLASITLPGVFIGALLCNPLGRRNTVGPLVDLSHI